MKRLCLSKKTSSLFFGALLCLTIFPCFAMDEGCLARFKARFHCVDDDSDLRPLMRENDPEEGESDPEKCGIKRCCCLIVPTSKEAILVALGVTVLTGLLVAVSVAMARYYPAPS